MPKKKPSKTTVKKPAKKDPADNLKALKGMRDLLDGEYFSYLGFFEKAAEIALYYGFQPIETPVMERADIYERGTGQFTDIVQKEMYTLKTKTGGEIIALRPEGTPGVMRSYLELGMQSLPQPISLFYYGPFFRHDKPQKGRLRELRQFGLEMIGSSKSIADATIINLFMVILAEAGLKNLQLEINSIGDTECRNAYRRELVNYYKKHTKEICVDCRERLKTNPLRVLDCKNPSCQEIKKGAPESIAYLCPPCKAHFKEVLEYLDSMNIPYSINNQIVRGLDYYSRTVFEISCSDELNDAEEKKPETEENKDEKPTSLVVAGGGRYDYLAKLMGGRKDIPAVGGGIGVDRVLLFKTAKKLAPRILKKPKIFFIQLGFDAKQKSFEIIEVLRKAKLPVAHSLPKDSLSAQLGLAEKLQVPYTLILGQKEALENTVIVRNMETRSQDTVKISNLADYLKKIKWST